MVQLRTLDAAGRTGLLDSTTLGGGGWTHVSTEGSSPVSISSAQTLVTANVADVEVVLEIPDPASAEGWIILIRKTSGSDGCGISLRPNANGDLTVEGDVVATRSATPESGIWQIPGSGTSSYDYALGDRLAPVATWMVYCDGDSWRFGPGTYARVVESEDPYNVGIDKRELISIGTFAGSFQYSTGGYGSKERAWVCTGFDNNGSGGFTPRWAPLTHVRVRTVDADATLNDFDEIVLVDTSDGDVDLTLPSNLYSGSSPSWVYRGNNEGRQILIVKKSTDTNLINVIRPDLSSLYTPSTPVVLINGVDADYELPESGAGTAGMRWHVFGDEEGNWWG